MKRECESCIKKKTPYCPTSIECMTTDDMPYYQNRIMLLEENKALLTIINWAVECGFGFDNFVNDEYVNWKEFEKESSDMGYIESMIYYAKKYNEMQELKQGSDRNEKNDSI